MSENWCKIKNAIPSKIPETGLYLAEKEREYIASVLMCKGFGDVNRLLCRLKSAVIQCFVTPETQGLWLDIFKYLEEEFLK